jgi:hypothetical protein
VAGRGAAIGDVNNDGSLDAVVAVLGGHPLLLRGHPNGNHWLTLKLVGTKSNRDAMGAKVRVGRQSVFCSNSGSYLSASDGRVHFGLGREAHATAEIFWPDGRRQVIENLAADRIVTVKEPE